MTAADRAVSAAAFFEEYQARALAPLAAQASVPEPEAQAEP